MTYDIVPGERARNLPTSSAELDFALVLARVIGSIENDPVQLRNVVYELARIKLQREAWQQHPPMSGRESRRMMLALEAAIDRVETMSSRYNELRAPQLLDRLIESSGFLPQYFISIEHNPVMMLIQQDAATRFHRRPVIRMRRSHETVDDIGLGQLSRHCWLGLRSRPGCLPRTPSLIANSDCSAPGSRRRLARRLRPPVRRTMPHLRP